MARPYCVYLIKNNKMYLSIYLSTYLSIYMLTVWRKMPRKERNINFLLLGNCEVPEG